MAGTIVNINQMPLRGIPKYSGGVFRPAQTSPWNSKESWTSRKEVIQSYNQLLRRQRQKDSKFKAYLDHI